MVEDPELLAFLAAPAHEQLRIGRSMRQNATKGEFYEIPTCVRCKSVSVLTVCRRCSSPKELEAVPKPPGAETFLELNRRQNRESPHREKRPSEKTVEAVHAWAKEHTPDLCIA